MDKPYRMCAKTVMDTTDPDIVFDNEGVSNHWHEYFKIMSTLPSPEKAEEEVAQNFNVIKEKGKKNKYDCLIGLSGGADSSYLAYIAHTNGLRPLIVHFDNGFNSELAVNNIEKIVKKLNFDLYTYVMDWEEFKDLQRAYYKASVIDLEIPNDHMIFGALHKIASKYNIKYILNGYNYSSEAILPQRWRYSGKFDLTNLKNIHKKFGSLAKLKRLPAFGVNQFIYYLIIRGIRQYSPLAYLKYDRNQVISFLEKEFGWKDYGGKHFESIHTRFYQGSFLPKKYNIDKRKAHFSSLICAGQMTRENALEELKKPAYSPIQQQQDKEYIAKKLGFSLSEFEDILNLPLVPHESYGTDKASRELLFSANRIVKKIFTKSFTKI